MNNLVAEGINYLKAMRSGNMNEHELAESLEISIDQIKRAIKAARDRKEEARKPFTTELVQPRYFIGKGVKGEFQTLKTITLEFQKSFTINYDPSRTSEFTVMLPVKVTVTRM